MKPASHTAELRSVGAMIGLRVSALSGFRNVSGMLLLGSLLSTGRLFKEILSECYILSFGHYSAGGLCWEVKGVGQADANGDHEFFSLSPDVFSSEEVRPRLQCFCPTKVWSPTDAVQDEEYAGIPTKVCFLEHYAWFGFDASILSPPQKNGCGFGSCSITCVYIYIYICTRYINNMFILTFWGIKC